MGPLGQAAVHRTTKLCSALLGMQAKRNAAGGSAHSRRASVAAFSLKKAVTRQAESQKPFPGKKCDSNLRRGTYYTNLFKKKAAILHGSTSKCMLTFGCFTLSSQCAPPRPPHPTHLGASKGGRSNPRHASNAIKHRAHVRSTAAACDVIAV